MKKKKNITLIILILIILILLIFGISYIIKIINYHKTYEYKFLKIGYTLEDTKVLNKLNNNN